MARLRHAALSALLVLLATAPSLADEGDAEAGERAELLFREGNRAFAEGDYQSAFARYREAWSLRKSFDIACNLGRTEAELGLYRDAAEHLDTCLRTFSVSSRTGLKDAKSRFRELFERVRAQVGVLEVQARPAGAEILVDGIGFGTAPLERGLFVDPGRRRVQARLRGYREQTVSVEVRAGGTAAVVLELAPAEPPAVTAVAPATGAAGEKPPARRAAEAPALAATHESRRLQPRTVVVLSGAGLTLVGLGVGLGFMLDAEATNEQAAKLAGSISRSSGTCSGSGGSASCRELRDALDREDRSRDIASGMFLGSALVSAATFGLWLALPDVASGSGAVSVLPAVARSGAGLSVSSRY